MTATRDRGPARAFGPCACGCGRQIVVIDSRGRKRIWARGHNGGPRKGQLWTAADDVRLIELWDAGIQYTEIARRIGRTKWATILRRCTLSRRAGGVDHHTTTDVATIFGVTRTGALHWVERGWIQARRSGVCKALRHGPGTTQGDWRISRDQLVAFLTDERYWGYWWPDDVQAGYWRAFVGELRGHAPLISTMEAGKLLGFTAAHVINLIKSGRLVAVRGTARRADGWIGSRAWYVRADLIPADMLPAAQRRRVSA